MKVTITGKPFLIMKWFLPGWLAGMEAEIVKDCEEYYMLQLAPPAKLTGKYFYLPKNLLTLKQ